MKTLADLKRRIKVGTRIEKLSHILDGENYNHEKTRAGIGVVRIVSKVQTNAWVLNFEGEERGSYLDIPKAKELSFNGDEFTITTWGGRLQMTYRLHD